MRFAPYGPYKLPEQNHEIDDQQKSAFWDRVSKENPSIPGGVGCYIFAIRAAKGYRPWYVGKTERQCFRDETWQPGKLLLYQRVLKQHKGTPVLFLLAKKSPKDHFVRPTIRQRVRGSISELERMLIATCKQRNSKLLNKMHTKYGTIYVPRYLNEKAGARTKNAKSLARLLRTGEA